MGGEDVVAHPEARVANVEASLAEPVLDRADRGVGRVDALVELGRPLLVAGALQPLPEEAVVVVAGNEHDVAAGEGLADCLEERAGRIERDAERALAELEHVAEEDQPVDVGGRLEEPFDDRLAAQHVGPVAGAEVEVGDEGGARHRRASSHPRRLARPPVDSDAGMESLTSSGPEAASTNGAGIAVENPATGETLAHVPETSPERVGELVAAARRAQPAWAEAGFEERGRILMAARAWMVANGERVVTTICAETGRPADETQFAELSYGISALEFWAKHAATYLADEDVETASPFVRGGRRLKVRYAPVGVVGVIGPWNYPLNNSFGDCIPALAAGNAVVLKPSEVTPLTSLLMAEMMGEVGLPADVFAVATGRGETGAALVDLVDYVMFTGSVRTGKAVMKQAAETLTPVSLELGGKDPMIVLADADLERAANAAASYGLNNSGQVCISVERIYVEDAVHDEFVETLTGKVEALRQGPPGEAGSVDVGAIIFPPQLELIDSHVRDAVERGAEVRVGGRIGDGPGRFYEPTVLTGVDHSMLCMTEETFGPTLPVMRVADAEEAVELANDGRYGLQASVWTRDTARGEALARRIEAGVACVNDAQLNYAAIELPMGGWKQSGLGSRHGPDGIRKYSKRQSILIAPGYAPSRELHMFPYIGEVTEQVGQALSALASSTLFDDAQRATLGRPLRHLGPVAAGAGERRRFRRSNRLLGAIGQRLRDPRGGRDRPAAVRCPGGADPRPARVCSTRSPPRAWRRARRRKAARRSCTGSARTRRRRLEWMPCAGSA